MKRLQQSILILVLIMCAAVSAAAATINIAAHTVNTTTTYPGSTCSLKIYSSISFTAADGTTVMAGVPGTGAFFKSVACTISSGVVTIPSFSLHSTTDALDNQTARYTAVFYDSKDVRRDMFLADFPLPTSLGTSVTWGQIKVYKAGTEPWRDTSTYIKSQTDAQIAQAAGTLNDASDVVKGRAFLNVAPQSSTSPVAVSTSWGRLNALALDVSEYGNSLNSAATAIGSIDKVTLSVSRATAVTANVTLSPNIELFFKNGGYLDAGAGTWTVGVQGPVTAPPSKIFYNFTAGQGTVSFAGNKTLTKVHPEWWGALGDNSTDNSTFLQAAANALVTNDASGYGSGTIVFGPGTYRLGTMWAIGSTTGGGDALGQFSGISLQGTNGLVGTRLLWTGSTSGQMVKILRGRGNRISDVMFDNAVAKGTTIGMWITGPPNLGSQTSGMTFTNCEFRNFNIGVQAGDVYPGSTSAASELLFLNSVFSTNNIGFSGAGGGNTLVNSFENTSFRYNAVVGLDVGTGGDTHVQGGGFIGPQPIHIKVQYKNAFVAERARFELSPADVAISATQASPIVVKGSTFVFHSTVPTTPLLQGKGQWTLLNNVFGQVNDTAIKTIEVDGAQGGSLVMINNRIYGDVPFHIDPGTTASNNVVYKLFGNEKWANSVFNSRFPNREGRVIWPDMLDVANNLPAATGDRICFAAQQAGGADIGAKVNACDTALGASKGEIHLTGGGNISTQIVVSDHHTLKVLSGTYTASLAGAPWLLKNNSTLECSSWGPILQESTGATGGTNSPFTIVGDYNAQTTAGALSQNIVVRGCHLKGARSTFDSVAQAVSIGNCQNCVVEGNWLDATRTIGIQAGAGSASGNFAKNVQIKNNLLTSVASQSIAVVNGEAITISGNQIISPGQTGGPGNTPIDIEPNASTDRIRSIVIENNLIDARNSPSSIVINAILVQNGAATSSYGPVNIDNNKIIGAALSGAGNLIAHGFIYVLAPNTHVNGNYLQRGFNCLNAESASGGSFTNNVLNGCGYTANYSILVENTSGYTVADNVVLIDPADALVAGQDRTIMEMGSSTGNRYSNNTADLVTLLGTSKVSHSTASNGYFSIGNGTGINRVLSGTATLDFDLTTVASQDLTITVTGAAVGDTVYPGVPNASVTADTVFFMWVSAADTVTVRASRIAGTPNPASGTFRAAIMQF